MLCSIQREYVHKQVSGKLTSFLGNLLWQVVILNLHFAMNDDQHLMELAHSHLVFSCMKHMCQEKNLIRAKNQKENITLWFREIQLPNCYEQMQVHQQEK